MSYDGIVAGAAFLGAILGIINLWFAYDERRLKIRLQTGHAFPVGDISDRARICNAYVAITNLSAFPIFVSSIGIVRTPMFWPFWRRFTKQLPDVFSPNGQFLPIEIRPRETKQIYFALWNFSEMIHAVYVETGCGNKKRRTSPGFKQIVREERVSH